MSLTRTILKKGLLLLSLPLALQLLLLTSVGLLQQQLAEAVLNIAHRRAVFERADSLLANLNDLESASRGFVITGDRQFVEPSKAPPPRSPNRSKS